MNNFGLFVIPIKVNNSINTYNDYIDFLVEAENHQYSHVYIGEHLTDHKEDIQSSMIFASALLAKTTTINACLSVLPLPHYNIKLLIKQLEDLEKLSKGRLHIGFSQGALKSDAEFLDIDHTKRNEIFNKKLKLFLKCIEDSTILNKLTKERFFSTLLSPLPIKSSQLFINGFSAVTSNFVNKQYWKNHIGCLTNKSKTINTNSKWNISMNLVPQNGLDEESYTSIKESLFYIYKKLNSCNLNVMIANNNYKLKDENRVKEILFKENVFEKIPEEYSQLKKTYAKYLGHPIVNIFDCIKDPSYCDYIYKLPFNGMYS